MKPQGLVQCMLSITNSNSVGHSQILHQCKHTTPTHRGTATDTFSYTQTQSNKETHKHRSIYRLSAKRCTNVGSDFWLSIKSVSNTLSCCCFVCAFIIGQYHSGNNMSSKSGTAGEILFFESEKRHEIRPLKTDTLMVSAFDAFSHVHDESKHYLSHWFAQRRYRFTQRIWNQLSLSFVFGVRGSEISLGRMLCVLKCFMTSIRRQCSDALTISFVETLLQSLWYVTASGANVLFYCQMSG